MTHDALKAADEFYVKCKATGAYYIAEVKPNGYYHIRRFYDHPLPKSIGDSGRYPERFESGWYPERFELVTEKEYIAAMVDWVIAGRPEYSNDPREI